MKPKKAPRKRPQQANDMDIDIDAYTSLAQGNDDIDVEFDERDLNDPNLLVSKKKYMRRAHIYQLSLFRTNFHYFQMIPVKMSSKQLHHQPRRVTRYLN